MHPKQTTSKQLKNGVLKPKTLIAEENPKKPKSESVAARPKDADDGKPQPEVKPRLPEGLSFLKI